MSIHISKLCAAAFYHLHNTSRIRRFLRFDSTKALVHALITSRVDYCNSLLYRLPATQLNEIQRILNAAARLVCRLPRYCHITPLMYNLHWLPVNLRCVLRFFYSYLRQFIVLLLLIFLTLSHNLIALTIYVHHLQAFCLRFHPGRRSEL